MTDKPAESAVEFDYQQWRKASAVTPEMLDACLDRIATLTKERDRWQWIATHEVCTEVVDVHGHEVPTIEEREEWELSQLMDAEKDRL